jgi:hypothetical protein
MTRAARPVDKVVQFRHAETISRFCDTFYIAKPEAAKIFADLMRWMWMMGTQPRAAKIPPVPVIDEMWHTFLVFTKDYTAFSQKYFGQFVHHVPIPSTTKRRDQKRAAHDPAAAKEKVRNQLLRRISTVWDILGEGVALRWYVTYAQRYDETFLLHRRSKHRHAPEIPASLVERAAQFERD